ncbi:MAG TPA: SRPBCC domain-containing protein [Candidatus Dormibacteraeota bacterium]|nr:SRPBCC domain-containing protein [Candidatus Dormibacteraeota bacterium]
MKDIDSFVGPVRKEIVVRCSPSRAFWIFTREINAWWPRRGHSVGGERSESIDLEPRTGGRLTETHSGGRVTIWGTILLWDPPSRLVIEWHPGRSSDEATEVEVEFTAEGTDTRVVLEHRGWERRADGGQARQQYDQGWVGVLQQLASAAERSPQYQVLFHRPGIAWQPGVPFREQRGVEHHQGFMKRLQDDGLLVVGGPFLDEESGGMVVLRAASVDDATHLAHSDPSIEAGLLTVTVRPWLVPMRNLD